MNQFNQTIKPQLSKRTLWLMTVGAGLVVANIYYNQPLLGMIAKELGISGAATSKIAMSSQIGYALGLLLIVPLGDMFKRKRLILIDFVFIILSLLLFAFGKSIVTLIIASLLIGFTSVVPQIFVPIAAQLSKPEEKSKNIAQVMSGLLIGVLASRVFSGLIGEYLGWREVFFIAAGIMIVFALLITFFLPEIQPTFAGKYSKLMISIGYYIKTIPVLRLASIRGALAFGSFSIFWTTLAFRLEQAPFFQGSDAAGSLGIIGIAGVLGASLVGYLANKMDRNTLISIAGIIIIVSWMILGIGGSTYTGLIVGIFLLDMCVQGTHVTNQTIIFSSHPEAANRLNTIYMVSYFLGGSLGTLVAGQAWQMYGWAGVVTSGLIFSALCLVIHLLLCHTKKYRIPGH